MTARHKQSPVAVPQSARAQVEPGLTRELQRILRDARAESMCLPDCDGLSLYLLNADFPQQALTREEMLAVMNEPSYWAFCWASGLVLAQFLLAQPHWVRGKRVLDFGCGSGVVAIAAARAGATLVYACDIDPLALQATRCNAELNGVSLQLCDDFERLDQQLDLIIVADVLYDKQNLPWLDRFIARAPQVLVADSRVKNFDVPPYRLLAQRRGCTLPDLDEFDEFRDVRLYLAQR